MLPILPVAPGTPMTHVNQCFLLTPIQTGRHLQPETTKPRQVPIRNQRSIRKTHREGHPMRSQRNPRQQWIHPRHSLQFIEAPFYLIEPHFYVIEGGFYDIEAPS